MVKYTWRQSGAAAIEAEFGSMEDQYCEQPTDSSFPTYGPTLDCQMQRFESCQSSFPGDLNSAWAACAENCAPLDQPCAPTRTSRLANGMYAPQLQQYFNVFKREHVLVVNFEKLVS